LVRISTLSENEKIALGPKFGMGALSLDIRERAAHSNHIAVQRGSNIVDIAERNAADQGFYNGPHGGDFIFKLDASGFMQNEKFMPIYVMEGIRFEFTLAPFAVVFKGNKLPGMAARQNFHASARRVTGYSVKNLKFHAEMVEFSAAVKTAIDAALRASGLPLVLTTWKNISFLGPNANNFTLRVHDRYTHVTAAFLWQRNTIPSLALAGNALTQDHMGHAHLYTTSYQWRLGTQTVPDQPMAVANDNDWRKLNKFLFAEYQKAWGTWNSHSDTPLYEKWCNLGPIRVGAVEGSADAFEWSYYTLGQVFQTSPGVDGSGTIIGDAADLECRLQVASFSSGALANKTLYMAIYHDRLNLLHPGGLADIQV
jgi:hypothetical protein